MIDRFFKNNATYSTLNLVLFQKLILQNKYKYAKKI